VVHAPSSKFFADLVGRCEPEIRYGNSEAAVEAKDVFRFQVTMIYAQGVTIFDSIEQLEKNMLDEMIVPEVSAAVKDLGEEITVFGVIHDNVSVIVVLDDAM
jgi:hypothetical protein